MTSLKKDLTEFLTDLLTTIQSLSEGGKQKEKEILSMLPKIFTEEPSMSLTLLEDESAKLECYTDKKALHLTELQINAKCGPLLETVKKSELQPYDLDTFSEYMNVEFVNKVKKLSVNSILAVPCHLGDGMTFVSLYYFNNKYAWSEKEVCLIDIMTKTAVWDFWAIKKMTELAAQASQLEVALISRDVIGQAKGILMAQNHITGEKAFTILRYHSQVLNKKLKDIAEFVTMTGELPSKDSKWL